MRVILLTSSLRGVASRVLPELCKNRQVDVAGVVLAGRGAPNKRRALKRKLKKIARIGLLGALNGIRLRAWYADEDVEDIRSLCRRLDVDLTETPHVNCDNTMEVFRELDADLGLSLGNGYISKNIFSIPKHGMINIHTEILPEFQGAQSIIWPIHERLTETGFTIHRVDRKIDTGDILFRERYPIKFCPKLKDTVRENLQVARSRIPAAFSFVCENFEKLEKEAIPQINGTSYTTPTLWQFIRMVRNNRKLYKESHQRLSS